MQMTASPTTNLDGGKGRDREVMQAAIELFWEKGYAATSVQDVADALGIDVWAAVKPARVGLSAWPDVPRSIEWKKGICAALGWPHREQADKNHQGGRAGLLVEAGARRGHIGGRPGSLGARGGGSDGAHGQDTGGGGVSRLGP